jgi:short-subunit dehydrogenase
MNENDTSSRILLTGASHGIGRCTALELGRRGAQLVLVGRSAPSLEAVCREVVAAGGQAIPLVADLLERRGELVDEAALLLGGLDALVHVAGAVSFRPFETETSSGLEDLLTLNLVAPLDLSRAALAIFKQQGSGHLVHVGSIFGSVGFPHFTAYSASKFGLRGFCEALRRELVDTRIAVTYVAPRATRTRLADRFGRMAAETKMPLDEPEWVAERIVAAMERRRPETFLGWAERIFVRLDACFPRLVDRLITGQTRTARPFAEEAAEADSQASPTERTLACH